MKTTIAVSAMALLGSAALAQVATNTGPLPPLPVDPLHTSQTDIWKYGVSFITPLIISFVRWAAPKIPALLLPSMSPLVGMLLGLAFNAVGLAHLTWVDSAVLGGLGVTIREIVDQSFKLQQARSKGPLTMPD